jgi:hypothetical protein
MAYKLAPIFNDAQQINSIAANGGLLFTYVAGSVNTKQTTYTDITGTVPQANPIVLNSRGEPSSPIWLTTGQAYKFVFAPSTDTDPPTSPIRTIDNITGINDASISIDQWVSSGVAPTYVSASSFTLAGDQTTAFHVGRRLKLTVTAGTVYGTISTSVFGALTTIGVTLDSGVLDAGLSAVSYGLLTETNPSLPGGLRQLQFQKLTTSGNFTTPANISTSTVFELTLVAGGGGGGAATVINGVAGGGGAGGAVKFLISGLLPSTAYAVVIGAAGTADVTGAGGGVGGTTQITINGTVYSCTGGASGPGTTTATGANINNTQGAASASITALPNEVIYQTNSASATTISGSYSGSNGASLPFGTAGFGGRTGAGAGGAGAGYGVGGGGGVGGTSGGDGAPGLFEARWIA